MIDMRALSREINRFREEHGKPPKSVRIGVWGTKRAERPASIDVLELPRGVTGQELNDMPRGDLKELVSRGRMVNIRIIAEPFWPTWLCLADPN